MFSNFSFSSSTILNFIIGLSILSIYFSKLSVLAGAIKGEIVIVIDAPTDEERNAEHAAQANDAAVRAQELIAEGTLSKKDIVKTLRSEFGISRNEAYELVIG